MVEIVIQHRKNIVCNTFSLYRIDWIYEPSGVLLARRCSCIIYCQNTQTSILTMKCISKQTNQSSARDQWANGRQIISILCLIIECWIRGYSIALPLNKPVIKFSQLPKLHSFCISIRYIISISTEAVELIEMWRHSNAKMPIWFRNALHLPKAVLWNCSQALLIDIAQWKKCTCYKWLLTVGIFGAFDDYLVYTATIYISNADQTQIVQNVYTY